MYIFLAIINQIGHDVKDALRSYWLTAKQFFTPFYTNTLKCDRFLNMLRFVHFSGNVNHHPDKNYCNYDRLWEMRTLFDLLNDAYAIFYSHLNI